MNSDELMRIKKLITDAETKGAKALGVMEQIEEGWQKDFGQPPKGETMFDIATKAYETLSRKIERQEEKKTKLEKELEQLYDWDALEGALA